MFCNRMVCLKAAATDRCRDHAFSSRAIQYKHKVDLAQCFFFTSLPAGKQLLHFLHTCIFACSNSVFSMGQCYSLKNWCGILTEPSKWVTTIEWVETKNSTTPDTWTVSAVLQTKEQDLQSKTHLILLNPFLCHSGQLCPWETTNVLKGSLKFNYF